jgi:Tfp pilus assembly protein PilZ
MMNRFGQGCRRRFPRFPLASAVEAGGDDGKVSCTSWGVDLGCGGVRISAPALLPEGRRFLVRLPTPAGPLARDAEVTWTALRAGLAGPTPGRPHGLRFLVPLPAATVLALTRIPSPEPSVPVPQERTIPAEAVSLPDIPIAGGGLFVRCPDPSPLGSLVRLRLLTPEGPPLSLAGRVVWANAGGHNPFPAGMGVQILEEPGHEWTRLRTLLERQVPPERPRMAEAWYAIRAGQPGKGWRSRGPVL